MKRKIKKQRMRPAFALTVGLLCAVIGTVYAARYDTLRWRNAQMQNVQTRRDLGELGEHTQSICRILASLQGQTDTQARLPLLLSLTKSAALAERCVTDLPLQFASSRSLLLYYSLLQQEVPPAEIAQYLHYGQQVSCKIAEYLSLSEQRAPSVILGEFPDFEHGNAVYGPFAYDPEHDEITVSAAKEIALRYLGNSISLHHDKSDAACPYYRFVCQNGFCDIQRSNGSLLRWAVYKKELPSRMDVHLVQSKLLEFWDSQNLGVPTLEQKEEYCGMQFGTYQSRGRQFYCGISLCSGMITFYVSPDA